MQEQKSHNEGSQNQRSFSRDSLNTNRSHHPPSHENRNKNHHQGTKRYSSREPRFSNALHKRYELKNGIHFEKRQHYHLQQQQQHNNHTPTEYKRQDKRDITQQNFHKPLHFESQDNSLILMLPLELYEPIFFYLSEEDLGILAQVCKQFAYFVSEFGWKILYLKFLSVHRIGFFHSFSLTCKQIRCSLCVKSGQKERQNELVKVSPDFENLSVWKVNYQERKRYLENWKNSVFEKKEISVARFPLFCCDEDKIIFTTANRLLQCELDQTYLFPSSRSRDTPFSKTKKIDAKLIQKKYLNELQHPSNISCLRLINSIPLNEGSVRESQQLLTGSEKGVVRIWDLYENALHQTFSGHTGFVQAIDCPQLGENRYSPYIFSGSFDQTVRQWDRRNESCTQVFELGNRVWSLQANQTQLVVGVASYESNPPLILFDIETQKEKSSLLGHRSTVYGVRINSENSNIIVSSSYDGTTRLWDIRAKNSNSCQLVLEDPDDYAIFCFAYDNFSKIVTGTAHHGAVRTWDIRTPNKCSTTFVGRYPSPVYSIHFDCTKIVASVSGGLYLLDYSVGH